MKIPYPKISCSTFPEYESALPKHFLYMEEHKKHQYAGKPSYGSTYSAISQYSRDPLLLLAQRNVSLQQQIVPKGKAHTEKDTDSTSCVKDILKMSTRIKN